MQIPFLRKRKDNESDHHSTDKSLEGVEKHENSSKPEERPPVHFFHPHLAKARNTAIQKWAGLTLFLVMVVLTVMSLYWAVLFHVEENLSSLVVYCVDFDGQKAPYQGTQAVVGPSVVQACESQLRQNKPSLGFEIRPSSEFPDTLAVRQAVYDQHAWAAIVVNPNATALLTEAVRNGNASYDPLGALQLIYITARQETTYYNYITPMLNMFETEVISMFGKQWSKTVLQNATQDTTLAQNLVKVPQAVNPAIGFSTFDLRPFGPSWVVPTVSVGLIYLIILSFFSYAFYMPIHQSLTYGKGHPPLHHWQMMIWHYLTGILSYFMISLAYSLVSLAFQIPFSLSPQSDVVVASNANAYGRGSFVVFWMLNFVGMTALGLASENVAMLIGMPWTSAWLIFWVVSNVSTGFYEITLAPKFYWWGYAWPLHNIVEGTRTILFGIHSRIGLNFGVLFAWVAVGTVLFPFACLVERKKTLKSNKAEKEEKQQAAREMAQSSSE